MSFSHTHSVDAPVEKVWRWHTRPGAVERLTPPFAPMRVRAEADNLRDGVTVFRLARGLTWRAEHQADGFRDGERFSDLCTSAPLAQLTRWHHTHDFHPDGELRTLVTDTVDTTVPAALLKRTFAYRQHQLNGDLAALDRLADFDARPLRIALTGSRGTVGRALRAQLGTAGHTVVPLVRSGAKEGERLWNPDRPAPDLLDGIDAVIHLAGEPIFGRFTDAHKARIFASRVGPTRRLAEVAATAGVDVFVSASAIGAYGADRGEEPLAEDAGYGDGFLADVVKAWEHATQPASAAGVRVVTIRTGIALSAAGGMLPLLRALYSTGLGGPIGDGTQTMSWIALDDLTDIYLRAVLDPGLSGPINAVAPHPVTGRDFATTLASVMHRPALLTVPEMGPKLLIGDEGARELALANQHVVAQALTDRGHVFRYRQLSDALRHELGHESMLR
ncbi:TIGR01777 family oxidoreductase [Corynebacterium uterequi]|uniref:Putative TIGR01777 family protein n=1 Tax=Corynebacterium uterequi TaxID=1072256 RepID=A0A0G3HEQ0_9CORY|nr:TIGR01777 family oxidoreductase [Corynebacterium uterequi]AKK11195.1 putative TIGR01777 family protein [Corynebacterium uterequi]